MSAPNLLTEERLAAIRAVDEADTRPARHWDGCEREHALCARRLLLGHIAALGALGRELATELDDRDRLLGGFAYQMRPCVQKAREAGWLS